MDGGNKAKRIAAKRELTGKGSGNAARSVVVPTGDQAPTGARTFRGPTVAGDALQSRITQARAQAAGNAANIAQVQGRTSARQTVQAFSNRVGPGSAAVRSVPGVNIRFGALSNRVDLLKPQIPTPRLVIDRSLPSPFLQKGGRA